mmetsp:Transcript_6358/g.23982  ORF Transcript_6358/g.23982 Transcript_6358/m.23982 type:complete len:212 (+) Transcript_6358:1138-1773(+)
MTYLPYDTGITGYFYRGASTDAPHASFDASLHSSRGTNDSCARSAAPSAAASRSATAAPASKTPKAKAEDALLFTPPSSSVSSVCASVDRIVATTAASVTRFRFIARSASTSVHDDDTVGTPASHASSAVALPPLPSANTAAKLRAVATPRSVPSLSTTTAHRCAEPSRTDSTAARAQSSAEAVALTRGTSLLVASATVAPAAAARAAANA